MRIRPRAAAGAFLLVAATVATGPVASGAAAPREISYAGDRGHAVYASFVVRGGKVVGLFAGGPCLPNVSLIEDGETAPVPIRDGRFRFVTNRVRYRVTLDARRTGTGSYRVAYKLVNKAASSSCHYTVIARRTTP